MAATKGGIIDLVDDSDVDEQPYAESASLKDEAIDLCDSDDDDRKPSPKTTTPHKNNVHASTKSSNSNSSKQQDEDVSNQKARRLTYPISRRKNRKITTPDHHIEIVDSDNDSDDDDDSILDMDIGLQRKPSVASLAASAPKPPPNQNVPIINPYKTTPASATPTHASPTSTTPIRPIRGRSLRPFPYPSQLTAHAKQYNDERVRFLLSFWKFARQMTRRSFERSKLDIVAKRVVRLALSEFPIRSIEEFASGSDQHRSVADARNQVNALREDLENGGIETLRVAPTPMGQENTKFYSVSEACLVALYKSVDLDDIADKSQWVSLADLIVKIDALLRPNVPGKLTRQNEEDNGASHYMDSSTRSVEFLQVRKLETEICGKRMIKSHTVKGKTYYELLPEGVTMAERILSRPFPAPPGHYRRSKIEWLEDVRPEYEGICLGVDLREGGGGTCTLHKMCSALDQKHVPYFVSSLTIGDYVFFTRNGATGDMNLLCPILVERKSVQDVAMSIYDNRWTDQKKRMYKGQYVFGYNDCRMVYIIEGNMDKQTVSGDYVGARWYNITTDGIKQEIDNLKDEGFEILRTSSVVDSMYQLSRWAKGVAKEIRQGKLVAKYTYEQFKTRVNTIPRQTDFSKIAKDHAATKQAAQADLQSQQSPSERANKDDGRKRKATESPGLDDEYQGWKKTELEAECMKFGLPKTGSRKVLIDRLHGPKPPALWLERKRKQQFVPERHNVAGTALLVALFLHETDVGPEKAGLTKPELFSKAEELNITKNPFSGGTTQTGPYHYDGWSSMSKLVEGDPALVTRMKGNRYKLTRSCHLAGFHVAKAMHRWCHEYGTCPCGMPTDET